MEPYISYLPIVDRPKITWPGNARLALIIVPNIEHYEYQPPHNRYKNPYPRVAAHPDVVGYAWRDYGNRVGFWRMLEVFDAYAIRATVSLNTAVLDRLPELRDAMLDRNWTFMSHGVFNTRYLFGMSESDEREFYAETIEAVQRHTGQRLRGMLGPSFSSSPNTPRLMAEAGFRYQMDWFVDDQPFPINVPQGTLVGVPYSREINDAFLFPGSPFFGYEGEEFLTACRDQFDTLYSEGEHNGRVMTIALHPFLISQPHRHKYLADALEYILAHSGVWQTTADEVAEYYIDHFYADARARSEKYAPTTSRRQEVSDVR